MYVKFEFFYMILTAQIYSVTSSSFLLFFINHAESQRKMFWYNLIFILYKSILPPKYISFSCLCSIRQEVAGGGGGKQESNLRISYNQGEGMGLLEYHAMPLLLDVAHDGWLGTFTK
jgi:hypothetical protein